MLRSDVAKVYNNYNGRMMLSDSKLLARLKEELAGMAAPTHADAHVFQSKITEASERHEVGRGGNISFSSVVLAVYTFGRLMSPLTLLPSARFVLLWSLVQV